MRLLPIVAALSLAFSGCFGGAVPTSGGACSTEGDFVCDPEDRFWAFECNDGKWRDVSCRSGGLSQYEWGCHEEEFSVECEVNQVRANEPCRTTLEGKEMCSILLDQRDIKLTCLDGTWVSTPCPSCSHPSGYPVKCKDE